MRISVRQKDSGTFQVVKGGTYSVTVDGIDITWACYAADDERGEAYCYLRTREGKHVINRPAGKALVAVVSGVVVITPTP